MIRMREIVIAIVAVGVTAAAVPLVKAVEGGKVGHGQGYALAFSSGPELRLVGPAALAHSGSDAAPGFTVLTCAGVISLGIGDIGVDCASDRLSEAGPKEIEAAALEGGRSPARPVSGD